MTMNSALMVVFITGMAQGQSPLDGGQGTLQAARKTFATTDVDKDGSLSKKEANAAGIPEREFALRDKDKNSSWSGEEFLPYYYELLKNSGKKPDKAFEDEVTRIEAARKAQEEEARRTLERQRKAKVKAEAGAGEADVAGDADSIEQKLKRAREALKDRSKRADAERGAFDRKAGELAERARGAADGTGGQGTESPEEEWAVKLRRARAALERRAKDGSWSREQLEAAERRLIERARAAEQGVDLTHLPAPVRSKYERPLVALSERAESGNWTREKYEAELADLLSRAKEELNNGGDVSTGDGGPEGDQGAGGAVTEARRTYERALAALDERAKAGGWTRERHEAARAELARRLQILDANTGGETSGSEGEEDSDLRSKVDRAQEKLEDRARRADMDRAQHQRISEELFERARSSLAVELVQADELSPVRTKHERAMVALINRAQRAEMTRAAFEIERDQILKRAKLEMAQTQEAAADEAEATKPTHADFDKAGTALIEELKNAPAETRTKYGRAMIALITRAQKAGMTRVFFERERDELMKRAR